MKPETDEPDFSPRSPPFERSPNGRSDSPRENEVNEPSDEELVEMARSSPFREHMKKSIAEMQVCADDDVAQDGRV